MRRFLGFLMLVAAAGVLVSIVGFVPGVKGFLQRSAGFVSAPLDSGARSVGGFFQTFADLFKLGGKNDELEAQILTLKSQLVEEEEVRRENEALRAQLGFATETDLGVNLPAQVIGRSPTALLDALVINRGSKDGVAVGQAVVWNGFLVGRVRATSPVTADVTLTTDRKSVIPILLQRSRGTGIVRGSLQGAILDDIPLDIKIEQGEAVLTTGLGGEFPPNLPLGEVEEVVSKESDIFQRAKMKVPYQPGKLEIVFVIIPRAQPKE